MVGSRGSVVVSWMIVDSGIFEESPVATLYALVVEMPLGDVVDLYRYF